jgi:protein SCO1/2
MTERTRARRRALHWLAAAVCAGLAGFSAAADILGDSIYQLKPALTDQDGRPFDLASLQGGPVLVSMFYSSCQMACPIIFETLRQTVKSLAPAERERVRILMITFDPVRDTAEVLKHTAEAHGCDANWMLARASESDTRKIAALLGAQYRRLASGEFNHSSLIEVLDAGGRITAHTSTLGSVDPSLLQALRDGLASP